MDNIPAVVLNLGEELVYPDLYILWFFSIPAGKWWNNILQSSL
jgi:hypothetical protein